MTFLFVYTSTTFGYINFSEEVKSKEFIKIRIPLNDYLIIQPIFLKEYSQAGLSIDPREKFKDNMKKARTINNKKDDFDDPFLEGGVTEDEAELTIEMIKKLKFKDDLFFLGVQSTRLDLYSQTNLVKSFPLVIPKFKASLNKSKDFSEDGMKRHEQDHILNKQILETNEVLLEMKEKQEMKNNDEFIQCLFQKNGVYSTYHESLPQYMFLLVYNCHEVFMNQKYQTLLKQNKDRNSDYIENIKQNINIFREKIYNQMKVLTLEIFSDQFISIETLINIENNLENYGKIKLFKNFREYLVIVYKPYKITKGKKFYLRIIIKKFDKYNGFKNVVDKKLYFNECSTPFYDILYYYEKKSGEKKFEKKTGKYSFDKSYIDQQGRPREIRTLKMY